MLIGDISRRNADFFGDREALVEPGGRVRTWLEVEERTNRMARALLDLGLGKGDRLAMFSVNCVEYVEFFFACAKSGVVGSPMNVRLAPPENVKYANYAEPRAVLVHASLVEEARAWIAETPSIEMVIGFGGEHDLDLDLEAIAAASSGDVSSVVLTPDDPYMLCPTSGTTGVSKGALMTQGNAISGIFGWLADYPVNEGDTNLQCIPQYLNAGGPAHIHPVFTKGGRSVILPGFDPLGFLQSVDRYRVTHTTAVPTMISMVLDHQERPAYDLSSLRVIVLGGSPVAAPLVVRVRSEIGDCLYPTLGMAETYSCGLVLRPQNQHPDGSLEEIRRLGSLGKPHTHLQVRIVGADGKDVPHDNTTHGEIWFKGGSVSPEYFRMPEETAAARVEGWLRTGDVAVIDDDGYVTVVDRLKDIIISGGYNVASGEVESVLCEHPAVAEAAVIGTPHDTWGEAVHAVIVRRPAQDVTEQELIEFAGARLAGYKRPRSVIFVSALPRNPTGKVLKRELRATYRDQGSLSDA
ncbi:long-chain fatty acid--CoA ligase [Nocardioides endophyticus]|uniref:Long-chain fatty acid--CoA ligase n=1 Tax=Nocardioides endophyticus TaxID=1353775 RepID=A0ABP8YG91_9ACTN